MSRTERFWRWFNPPLPDVMQAEMLDGIEILATRLPLFYLRQDLAEGRFRQMVRNKRKPKETLYFGEFKTSIPPKWMQGRGASIHWFKGYDMHELGLSA